MTNVKVMGGYIGREARALWLAGATETSSWSGRALIAVDETVNLLTLSLHRHRRTYYRQKGGAAE